MKKSAIVRFIGDQEHYQLTDCGSSYKYCRDCTDRKCNREPKFQFVQGHLYNAYFLEYWEGERTSLHVKGEDCEVNDFIPFEDFEVVEDCDNVLNKHEAIVRCITHDYDDEIIELLYGKEYKAIGFDTDGLFLVLDESYCCYFYSPDAFEIVDDPYGVLDPSISSPVYDWENTHEDSLQM